MTKADKKVAAKPRGKADKPPVRAHEPPAGELIFSDAAAPGAEEPAGDLDVGPTVLSAVQRAFLERVARFLFNVRSPQYIRRAMRNHYTNEEHKLGWDLYHKAGGGDRPLDHWFTEEENTEELTGVTSDRKSLLGELDRFENRWFPRVRAVIQRWVPRGGRDAFEAAFFMKLEQQPLGPTVINSVKTLLQRVEDLKKSDKPGARKVFEVLQQRGLTDAKIAETRALLKRAEEGTPAVPVKAGVTAAELAKAQKEQQEAYEDLKDWFNDWATQLRPVFNIREQIVLGLTVRTASGAVVDTTGDTGAGGDTGAAGGEAQAPAGGAAKAAPRKAAVK
jgi:hypothetical protein